MSAGRLVILPKKSYCPWNSKNVERVLRDERVDRERKERELEALRHAESRQRWETLKQQRQEQPRPHDKDVPQRFCLFEKEEAEEERALGLAKVPVPQPSKRNNQQPSAGILPVFLGESVAQEKASQDAQRAKQSTDSYRQREETRKHRLDPMNHYSVETSATLRNETLLPNSHVFWHADAGSHEKMAPSIQNQQLKKRERKKKKRRRSDSESSSDSDSSKSSNSSKCGCTTDRTCRRHERRKRKPHKRRVHHHKSKHRRSSKEQPLPGIDMDELRKRRLEREQEERLREQAVIREATGMTSGQHRYHNQYNPRFSRK